MFYLGLKNLRCLDSVKPIQIKPITVLVGMNSSGKSTFLRCLPLLRQSITTRTSSPILWYGDWVDFGDFNSSVSGKPGTSEISFTFGSDKIPRVESEPQQFRFWGPAPRPKGPPFQQVFVDVTIAKSETSDGTNIKSIILHEGSNHVKYVLSISEEGSVHQIAIDDTLHFFATRPRLKDNSRINPAQHH